ncbi:MAG: hypothetical protein FD167_5670, partial [bacterium]
MAINNINNNNSVIANNPIGSQENKPETNLASTIATPANTETISRGEDTSLLGSSFMRLQLQQSLTSPTLSNSTSSISNSTTPSISNNSTTPNIATTSTNSTTPTTS